MVEILGQITGPMLPAIWYSGKPHTFQPGDCRQCGAIRPLAGAMDHARECPHDRPHDPQAFDRFEQALTTLLNHRAPQT